MLARLFQPDERKQESFILFPERREKLLEIEWKLSELLTLADFIPLRVALAAYAANHLKQIPVWIMIVAPPSSGKTEILGTMYRLPGVEVLSDITKSSLLSGVSSKDRTKNATGGLLHKMGRLGFFIVKDFTSMLSQHKDDALTVFAAFREIYDGDYSRHFGSDGGSSREWHGRLGLVAAVTPAIEKHSATFSTMGERFLTIRIHDDEYVRAEQAEKAYTSSGTESEIRAELQNMTASLFEGIKPETVLPEYISDFVKENLISLAELVALCRTPVEYSSHSKEVEQIHKPEGPGRITKQLQGLFLSCVFIGCSLQEAWEITVRVAMDTIPEQRATILEHLIRNKHEIANTISSLKATTRLPYNVNRRIVEELFSLRILDASFSETDRLKSFRLSDRFIEKLDAIQVQPVEPEDFSSIREDHLPTTSLPEIKKKVSENPGSEYEKGVEDVA